MFKLNFPKIKEFYTKYKWLLLPGVPMLALLFLLLTTPQGSQPSNTTPTPLPAQETSVVEDQPLPDESVGAPETEHEIADRLENQPGFQKREEQPNGTFIYYFESNNPARPNITITNSSNEHVFSRKIAGSRAIDTPLATYETAYGKAERVINKVKSYPNASLYIYASIGLAVIADPKTGKVYEEHLFREMSVEGYLKRFSDQN